MTATDDLTDLDDPFDEDDYQAQEEAFVQAMDDTAPDYDEWDEEGHESLDGAHMGETIYCDGSCR